MVARSRGIDDDIAQALCQWSPTHDGLFDSSESANSLNYFLIGERHFAISKSVVGGTEYSGRRAFQTVTTILVGEREDLSVYQCNPISLARMALSMGWLRLIVDYDDPMEFVELPANNLPELMPANHSDEMVDRAATALTSGKRIAIVGAANPVQSLLRIFAQIPTELRITTSFSTGVKASTFRPFQIHFFNQIDNRLRDFLTQQRIVTLRSDLIT